MVRPDPVTPPPVAPRSEGLGSEPFIADNAGLSPVTGLRARLTGVYVGLSDRLARWFDRGDEARVVTEVERDAVVPDAGPVLSDDTEGAALASEPAPRPVSGGQSGPAEG